MNCSNCSSEVPAGTEECPLCHFRSSGPASPVPPIPARSAVPSVAPPEQSFEVIKAPERGKIPLLLSMLVLLLLAGLALFFLIPIPGLPVPAGSYEDKESHFAVSPVARGWNQTNSGEKKGGLIEAVAFRKPDGEGPLRAAFIVFVLPQPLPDFTEEAKDRLQGLAVSGLSTVFEGYRQESAQDATMDNLKALRLMGSLRPQPAAVAVSSAPVKAFEYKTTAMLVPGTDRAYLLASLAPASEQGALQPLFDMAFASFRVTARPLAQQQKVTAYSRIVAIAGAALLFILIAYKILCGAMS